MPQPVTLRPGGVEFIHWSVTGLPADPPVGAVEVSVDKGTTWKTATVAAGVVSVLVAHPSVASPDPTAAVAVAGATEMLVRLTDAPETVIRSGGWLRVLGV